MDEYTFSAPSVLDFNEAFDLCLHFDKRNSPQPNKIQGEIIFPSILQYVCKAKILCKREQQ